MGRPGVELFPILVAAIFPVTFFTTYAIAVGLGHTEADFPYISDTGTKPPESCIFGQLLNIIAVLVGITCYIRYRQLAEYCQYNTHLQRANTVSMVFGMCSALGLSLVGNFQETSVIIVHITGAMMAFGFGVIYCWLSTIISFSLQSQLTPRCTCLVRLCVSVVSTLGFVMYLLENGNVNQLEEQQQPDLNEPDGMGDSDIEEESIIPKKKRRQAMGFAALANTQYHGDNKRKWLPTDGGFTYHLISSVSEWVMAGAFIIFFVTFVPEFRKVSVTMPVVTVDVIYNTNAGITNGDEYADDEPMIT